MLQLFKFKDYLLLIPTFGNIVTNILYFSKTFKKYIALFAELFPHPLVIYAKKESL